MAEEEGLNPEVAVGLIVKGDAVLMVRRKPREGLLRWSFPGGSIEPGENDAAAVVREVEEETGVKCRPERRLLIRRHPNSGIFISYWLCSWLSGEPRVKESRKADRAQWIEAGKVHELVTSDIAWEMLNELRRIEEQSPRP